MTPEAQELARRRLKHRMAEASRRFLDAYQEVMKEFVGNMQSSSFILVTHAKCEHELHERAKACWELVRGVIDGEGLIPSDDNKTQIQALIEEALTAESKDLDGFYERARRAFPKQEWPDLGKSRRNAIDAAMAEVEVDLLSRRRRRAAIEDELGAPRYQPAREHWRKALGFAEQEKPDFENAVKEAVSAVESLAQVVVGSPGMTLGDAIKALRSRKRIAPGADAVIEGLWTFANTSPGVRHGSAREAQTTDSDWAFARTTSEASLRLLLDVDSVR